MTGGADRRAIRLDYEAKWFLPVPTAFPSDGADDATAWVDGLLAEHEVMEPWRDPSRRADLRELLLAQHADLAGHGGVALWYCPFGLPASGVVEIAVEDREGRPADPRAELAGLRGDLPVRPVDVRARGLGSGVGYARVFEAGEPTTDAAAPRIAELGYVFTPDACAVAVRARSADPSVVGALSEQLWRLVDSVVLS